MNNIINGNHIFVISGVAGSGKGSVASVLKHNPQIVFSVSSTTRKPRKGEIEGKDYYFITDKEFDDAVQNEDFIEWEHVHQNRYGTKKSELINIIKSGKNALLEIDVNGAENIKKILDNVVTIFITPPNIEEAYTRLENRDTENLESMRIRKSRYSLEIEKSKYYDHIIINDDLNKAQQELENIIDRYLKS